MPATVNYTITQAASFTRTVRWGSGSVIFKPVTAVSLTAPVQLTAVGHGLTAGWPFSLAGIQGPALNGGPYQATVIDPNTLAIATLDASAMKAYKTGGMLSYNAPVDLTGLTARLDFRQRLTDATPLLELTVGAGITLDPVAQTLTFLLTPTQTSQLAAAAKSGVLALFVTDAGGTVTPLLSGSYSIDTEAVQ